MPISNLSSGINDDEVIFSAELVDTPGEIDLLNLTSVPLRRTVGGGGGKIEEMGRKMENWGGGQRVINSGKALKLDCYKSTTT